METNDATTEEIQERIRKIATEPLVASPVDGNDMLRIIGIKTFLDGGMLTGSAYMREPWGVSKIYSIEDPEYRGVRFIEPEKLYQMARLTLASDLQFTAHSQGDAAVEAMVAAYERIDKNDFRVRDRRPSITHASFMSKEAIDKMKALGIVAVLLWQRGKKIHREQLTDFFWSDRGREQGQPLGGRPLDRGDQLFAPFQWRGAPHLHEDPRQPARPAAAAAIA